MLQSTPTTQNLPSSPGIAKKPLTEPIGAGSPTLSLAHFTEKQQSHLHQQPQPRILHSPHNIHSPSVAQPKPTSGRSSFRSWRGELKTFCVWHSSKLIRGQPTAALGGDGCSREAGWDECAAELVAVFRTFSLSVSHFWLPSPSQLLFPRLGRLNKHSSRHKAPRQNHQGFSTEFRDRIQKLGPMRAEVPSDGDVTAAAKERSFQDELKASRHSTGNEGLAIFIFLLIFF